MNRKNLIAAAMVALGVLGIIGMWQHQRDQTINSPRNQELQRKIDEHFGD
jgi:hypothetical protein